MVPIAFTVDRNNEGRWAVRVGLSGGEFYYATPDEMREMLDDAEAATFEADAASESER